MLLSLNFLLVGVVVVVVVVVVVIVIVIVLVVVVIGILQMEANKFEQREFVQQPLASNCTHCSSSDIVG